LAPVPPDPSAVPQALEALRAGLDLPGKLESFAPWQAALFVIPIGILFLLYGFRLYRVLAIVLFAMLGLVLGLVVAGLLQVNATAGMVVGALVLGVLAWPLVRLAWAVTCGVLGAAIVGLVTWALVPSGGEVVWAVAAGVGFLIGAVAGTVCFRVMVIVATSVYGGTLLVWGTLRLTLLVPSIGDPVMASLAALPWLLGILVLVPGVFGVIAQLGDEKTLPKKSRKSARRKGTRETEE